MRGLFERLNTPGAVIALLVLFFVVNGLLFYRYQHVPGLSTTPSARVTPGPEAPRQARDRVPAGETASETGDERAPDEGGAGRAGGGERTAAEETRAAPDERDERESGAGDSERPDTEEEGDRGVPGPESLMASVSAWCAPEAVRGEPAGAVLAASAGRWATMAAVQRATEPAWRLAFAVTEPAWRWMAPVPPDDGETAAPPDAAPNNAVPDDAPPVPQGAPRDDAREVRGDGQERPVAPAQGGETQYTGETTSGTLEATSGTTAPTQGGGTAQYAGEATSGTPAAEGQQQPGYEQPGAGQQMPSTVAQ